MLLLKIIAILVGFQHKMEVVLGEIRKLVPGLLVELSQPPLPPPKEMPQKEKPLEEVKTPLPQRPGKELVAKSVKIELPAAVAKTKTGKDSDTPETSSEPSPWKMSLRKTKKELTPKLESDEEEDKSLEEIGSSSGDPESKEEAEPATSPPEKKKRMDT